MSYDSPTRAVSDSHNRLTAVVHNAYDTCGLADAGQVDCPPTGHRQWQQPHRGALRASRYMTMQLSLERTTGSSRIQRAFVSQLGPSACGHRDWAPMRPVIVPQSGRRTVDKTRPHIADERETTQGLGLAPVVQLRGVVGIRHAIVDARLWNLDDVSLGVERPPSGVPFDVHARSGHGS